MGNRLTLAGRDIALRILQAAEEIYGYSVEELVGKSRTRGLTKVRQGAYGAIYSLTDLSYPEVGDLFNRDHTTIMHGVAQSMGGDMHVKAIRDRLVAVVEAEFAADSIVFT